MAALLVKLFGFSPLRRPLRNRPNSLVVLVLIHLRASALRRTGGAGEGIRTPDRLITNQLLYRTELRQPRQKIICSTCRATGATYQVESEKTKALSHCTTITYTDQQFLLHLDPRPSDPARSDEP